MRRIHAAPLSLALLAFLGLVGMATGGSAFAQTPTPVITIEESIATLREMIAEVESGRGIILAPYGANALGGLALIDRDRVGTIAVWLVLNGWVDPDSVSIWTRQQLAASNAVLEILKRQLRELEAQQPAAGTPTAAAPGATPGAAGVTPTAATRLATREGNPAWHVQHPVPRLSTGRRRPGAQ